MGERAAPVMVKAIALIVARRASESRLEEAVAVDGTLATSDLRSGTAVCAPPPRRSEHVLRVARGGIRVMMYWFHWQYVNSRLPKANRQFFVRKVRGVNRGRVRWGWMDDTGSISTSRLLGVAKSEGIRHVMQVELTAFVTTLVSTYHSGEGFQCRATATMVTILTGRAMILPLTGKLLLLLTGRLLLRL